VGPESLIAQGLEAGAVGAVSALGAAFPDLVAAEVNAPETLQQSVAKLRLGAVRAALERFPFQSALKTVLARRGLPINPDVRRPLRTLTEEERAELETWLESSLRAPAR
jgi:dihydrodipicolinate synthase/N-acetylneuraminate lyase